jgi:hypothetical protein
VAYRVGRRNAQQHLLPPEILAARHVRCQWLLVAADGGVLPCVAAWTMARFARRLLLGC